jgi:hypothetical protein
MAFRPEGEFDHPGAASETDLKLETESVGTILQVGDGIARSA